MPYICKIKLDRANSRHLEAEVHLKLLISQTQSKFSGPRKFTLRYKQFRIRGVEMQRKIGNIRSKAPDKREY